MRADDGRDPKWQGNFPHPPTYAVERYYEAIVIYYAKYRQVMKRAKELGAHGGSVKFPRFPFLYEFL